MKVAIIGPLIHFPAADASWSDLKKVLELMEKNGIPTPSPIEVDGIAKMIQVCGATQVSHRMMDPLARCICHKAKNHGPEIEIVDYDGFKHNVVIILPWSTIDKSHLSNCVKALVGLEQGKVIFLEQGHENSFNNAFKQLAIQVGCGEQVIRSNFEGLESALNEVRESII